MALVEGKEHDEAVGHLSAVGERFWELFAKLSPDMDPSRDGDRGAAARRGPFTVAVLACLGAGGGGPGGGAGEAGGGKERRSESVGEGAWKAPWSAAVLDREGFTDLGGLYASSLFLLGECLALCPPSSSSSPLSPLVESRRGGVLPSAAANGAALSASREDASRPQDEAAVAENPRAHLNAAAETLEASAEAFLNVDDPAGAVDSLAKLVEVLELIGDENEGLERDISSVEVLCNRASAGLLPSGEGNCDRDNIGDNDGAAVAPARDREESCDILETEGLACVREGIERLRARWSRGSDRPERDLEASGQDDRTQGEATDGKELRTPSGGNDGPGQQRQKQQHWQENSEPGNSATADTTSHPGGGDAAAGSTGEAVGARVGPLPTAGFAQRRKRQIALLLAPALVGGRGGGKAVSRAGNRPAASSGASDPVTAGLVAKAGERLPQGEGGSFAAMRAMVAAAGGVAAANAIVAGGNRRRGNPEAVGGWREDHGSAVLASYRHTVREKARSLAQDELELRAEIMWCRTIAERCLSVPTNISFFGFKG